jgi:hypothetical protein
VKTFHCERCSHVLFFENTSCVGCDAAVGFSPDGMSMRIYGHGTAFRACRNYAWQQVCNWLLPADSPDELCRSCALTTVIPDLDEPGNHDAWYRLETAKRRLIYTLLWLGLPLVTRAQDPAQGLAFHFKSEQGMPAGEAVLTGHADGVITVNIAEADDAERERRRVQLHEPYRTLLGHFRHEIGHYYWDRLIRDGMRLRAFRELFGDETQDYGDALQAHYAAGPKPTWQDGFISGYATSHPWEDWAETWAHYLHMVDGLETAGACGLALTPPRPDEPALAATPLDPARVDFAQLQRDWAALTYVMNNLNRSMGLNDPYPFVLSARTLAKLEFVHRAIGDSRARG